MNDRWYEIARLDHFWIARRFEVLRGLADGLIRQAGAIAEVGCGQGLLQRQMEDFYQVEVTGFDLNAAALERTASRVSPVCCYDLLEQASEYAGRFDLMLLFDVLEHIHDEARFLRALEFHLAPGGRILINVPAFQWLWSRYDQAVGHQRRYTAHSLRQVAQRNGLVIARSSYWGLPLVPLLVLRKLWLARHSHQSPVSAGFSCPNQFVDRTLLWLSRCERIPQRLLGTSLMAVLERAD